MPTTLNITQVSKVLGRSTKSIRNYIKEGRLSAEKISSPRGMEYRFEFTDLASFAKKHLNISVEGNIPAFNGPKGAGRPTGSQSGFGDLAKMMSSLEREKTDLLKELGELRAQAGYKIGQLESQIKLLEAARSERDALQSKVSTLEEKVGRTKQQLDELQKVKAFYESKRWWQFWKGKYPSTETVTTEVHA